jgi:hypothetical protein
MLKISFKNLTRIAVISMLTLGSVSAQAQVEASSPASGQENEFVAGGRGISFGGDNDFSADLNLAYNRVLPNAWLGNIQATLLADTTITDPSKTYHFLVGPTLNFTGLRTGETGLENAMFLGAAIGLSVLNTKAVGTNVSNTETEFAWLLSAGKRFAINRTVSWKPQISLGKGTTFSSGDASFNILPFQFSFFF